MNGCSFQQVLRQYLGWFLSQHWKTLFLRGLILKLTERDFQNSPPFDVTIRWNFKRLQTLTLKQILWKTKIFFIKLENRLLVESTTIENAPFSYKTAISEANVKTNRMVRAKWTYHKERSFASNHFIFSKILFQFKNLLLVDLMYRQPKCPYSYFL